MKKILILTNKDTGLYKFRKELLQELISSDYKVYISLPDGQYVGKMVEMGCQYIRTNIDRRGTNPFKDLKLVLTYYKMLKKIKPDVVLTYTVKPNIYGGFICGLKKIPYISNVTGLGTSIENPGIIKKLTLKLYKLGLFKSFKVFFQNQSNKYYFEDISIVKSNTQLIPGSGVNLKEHCLEPYPLDDGNIRLLFIGRVMKDKGIDELIYCAKKFQVDYNNVYFDIVGPCDEDYEEKLVQLESDGVIKYFGQQDDVHSFIKTHHATILPSYHEGLANVLLESAACGRPVLASNVPGCMETFDDNKSGFGFNVKDSEDLYRAIKTFIELSYKEKMTMGFAGRKKVENEFDRNIVVEAYMKNINQICNIQE